MIELTSVTGNVVEVRATGKLSSTDLENYASKVEKIIEKIGVIRILADATHLDGWENKKALEAHLKMVKKNHKKVERMGMISNRMWQKWMLQLVGVFANPQVRTADHGQAEEIRAWIYEGVENK